MDFRNSDFRNQPFYCANRLNNGKYGTGYQGCCRHTSASFSFHHKIFSFHHLWNDADKDIKIILKVLTFMGKI